MSKRMDRANPVFSKNQILDPDWQSKFKLFTSKTKATDAKTVIAEYRNLFDNWLLKNRGKDINLFRQKYGIIVDEKGYELLTGAFKNARRRAVQEFLQAPKGTKLPGIKETRLTAKLPWWFEDAKKAGLDKLEGHHVRGLNVLDIFYEGADWREAFAMRQGILQHGHVGGKDLRNWAWLSGKQHDLAHKIAAFDYGLEAINPKTGLNMKGKSPFSKKLKSFIRSLPRTSTNPNYKGQSLFSSIPKLDKGNLTRLDLLIDWLDLSDEGLKRSVFEAIDQSPIPGVSPTIQKGQLARDWNQPTPQAVSRYGDPASTALTGRPRLEQRVTGIDGLPVDYSNEGKAAVNDIFNEIDGKQIKGAKFGGNVPTSVLRARAKQLALLGIAGVSVVGTGASAIETTVRTDIAKQTGDWRDKAQAGISGFSLANDVGSYSGVWALPGAVLSTGADGLNWLIDDLRSNNSRLKQIDWDAIGKASYSLGGLI